MQRIWEEVSEESKSLKLPCDSPAFFTYSAPAERACDSSTEAW